jgi:hypothetical protein
LLLYDLPRVREGEIGEVLRWVEERTGQKVE